GEKPEYWLEPEGPDVGRERRIQDAIPDEHVPDRIERVRSREGESGPGVPESRVDEVLREGEVEDWVRRVYDAVRSGNRIQEENRDDRSTEDRNFRSLNDDHVAGYGDH